MIFRFRISKHSEAADSAQGWVVAASELQARVLVGPHAYFQLMPAVANKLPLNNTVFVTQGSII
jgi:hypothetical protein